VTAADVILPFPSSSSDHWIQIRDERETQTRQIPNIPRNAYRALLDLCVSHHDRDEFWYANKPNAYFASNKFTELENGPFREIPVTIDDLLAGVVHPFPVIYTGGVNPFFWRPVTAIGSFVLPSDDLDIAPFLPQLLNPKPQTPTTPSLWPSQTPSHSGSWVSTSTSGSTPNLPPHTVP
jgi:hypothetical protein